LKKTNGYRELKQATFRHLIEVMEGNYDDNGSEFGHLEAISKRNDDLLPIKTKKHDIQIKTHTKTDN
jgi:hypothetical protein